MAQCKRFKQYIRVDCVHFLFIFVVEKYRNNNIFIDSIHSFIFVCCHLFITCLLPLFSCRALSDIVIIHVRHVHGEIENSY